MQQASDLQNFGLRLTGINNQWNRLRRYQPQCRPGLGKTVVFMVKQAAVQIRKNQRRFCPAFQKRIFCSQAIRPLPLFRYGFGIILHQFDPTV